MLSNTTVCKCALVVGVICPHWYYSRDFTSCSMLQELTQVKEMWSTAIIPYTCRLPQRWCGYSRHVFKLPQDVVYFAHRMLSSKLDMSHLASVALQLNSPKVVTSRQQMTLTPTGLILHTHLYLLLPIQWWSKRLSNIQFSSSNPANLHIFICKHSACGHLRHSHHWVFTTIGPKLRL